MKNRYNIKCKLLLFPSIIGILIFYVVPFLRVIWYSLIENQFSKQWVGLGNYKLLLENIYFRLAMKNSFLLIVIGVPLLVMIALSISVCLLSLSRRLKKLRVAFILPMLIPTTSIVVIWRALFLQNETALPIYSLFIWKNIGIAIILLTAAFSLIEPGIYEAAKLDGAYGIRLHRRITIPLIMPTIFFVTLLGVVYSFRIFKESYLFYGSNYPPEHGYTLQYYMNNHFMKLNYQNLAAGAVITTGIICFIVLLGIKLQRRIDY